MGFLHKLWDETLAGPTPDSGLGKLRKYDSFSTSNTTTRRRPVVAVADDHVMISRSITILRNNSSFKNLSVDTGSAPDSPSGSCISPMTPLTPGTPPGDFKRFTRRKTSAKEIEVERAEPRSPTVYDWIVISALDR